MKPNKLGLCVWVRLCLCVYPFSQTVSAITLLWYYLQRSGRERSCSWRSGVVIAEWILGSFCGRILFIWLSPHTRLETVWIMIVLYFPIDWNKGFPWKWVAYPIMMPLLVVWLPPYPESDTAPIFHAMPDTCSPSSRLLFPPSSGFKRDFSISSFSIKTTKLCSSSVIAVTNNHRLRGLKQHEFIVL